MYLWGVDMRLVRYLLVIIECALYFAFCGSKQKQIDCKNKELACFGGDKICTEIKFTSSHVIYSYMNGNPSMAKKNFKTFKGFLIMRGLK